MNPAIRLVNRQRKRQLDLRAYQKFAEAAVTRVRMGNRRIALPDEICVFFVSDARIRRIHRDFLAADEATDVITFHHGEIFISVETAERHAHRFSTSLSEEIHLYIVHALLHLAGFEDKTKRGYHRMKAAQEKVANEVERALGMRRARRGISPQRARS